MTAVSTATVPETRIHIVQGECHTTADPTAVLITILGSCVAACMHDPVAGVGGMNHFLLPGEAGVSGMRYGVNAMELLINGLLKLGAQRNRLEAKLFGGANVVPGLSDIGSQNAAFAERYLRDEGITCTGSSLGGLSARRLQYWPVSGRARQLFMPANEAPIIERQRPPRVVVAADDGDVDLF
ncbi:MAG: chemotaxis protein CheD [Phenylobacterium sp.]